MVMFGQICLLLSCLVIFGDCMLDPDCFDCPACLDIAIAVDSSSSVGEFRWRNRINPFLREFAKSNIWTIGISNDSYQIAIVSYSTHAVLNWNFGDAQTLAKTPLRLAIKNTLDYLNGTTNTGEALQVIREQVLTDPDNRPHCADVCLVITDGATNPGEHTDIFNVQFPQFKAACDKVIVVGISTEVDRQQLATLASQANYNFEVDTFNGLETVFPDIARAFCDPIIFCPECLDIAIIMDASGSIGSRVWRKKVIPFLREFVNNPYWTVGDGQNETQIAVVTYSSEVNLAWNWGDPETSSKASFRQALKDPTKLIYSGLLTNTGAALNLTTHQIVRGPNNRVSCSDVCVVITDGATNPGEHTQIFNEVVDDFRNACARVIAVGVSTSVPPQSLDAMTGVADYVLQVHDIDGLSYIFNDIAFRVCRPSPVCPQCADVALILDSSASIGSKLWRTKVRNFVRFFAKTSQWTIGSALNETQLALVSFSQEVFLNWNWGDPAGVDRRSILQSLKNEAFFPYLGSLTNTGAALNLVTTDVIDSEHDRDSCPNICIVVTDGGTNPGNNTNNFNMYVGPFKDACDSVIAVGVTTSVPDYALDALATQADFAIRVEDYSALEASFFEITSNFCPTQNVKTECPECLSITVISDPLPTTHESVLTQYLLPFVLKFLDNDGVRWTPGSGTSGYLVHTIIKSDAEDSHSAIGFADNWDDRIDYPAMTLAQLTAIADSIEENFNDGRPDVCERLCVIVNEGPPFTTIDDCSRNEALNNICGDRVILINIGGVMPTEEQLGDLPITSADTLNIASWADLEFDPVADLICNADPCE